jgi:predicted nucleotidyltransferase
MFLTEKEKTMNIQQTAAKYFVDKPVKNVYLFGSYARNEQQSDSDIDLLLDIDYAQKKVDLFDLYDWIEDLQVLLNKKVDLIPSDGLSPFMAPFIEADKILIYAK